jgi:hypothetical protein
MRTSLSKLFSASDSIQDFVNLHFCHEVTVLDLVSQVRDTVLMSVYLEVKNLGGSGFWNEGLMSKDREMGSSVYKQSETEVDGSCHSKEGSK